MLCVAYEILAIPPFRHSLQSHPHLCSFIYNADWHMASSLSVGRVRSPIAYTRSLVNQYSQSPQGAAIPGLIMIAPDWFSV